VLLGSGWGPVADRVQQPHDLSYDDLPAFPELHIDGHHGFVRSGRLAGQPVWVLRGRKHAYEHGDAGAMKGAIRSLAAAGVHTLIQTNAAGSLDQRYRPGSLMLIRDHLNLAQRSPLVNDHGPERFVDLRDAYDPTLALTARAVARERGIELHEGVYAWLLGPQFETPAEIRMLITLGAQAVGMSTVPETILARHAGMKVLALSMFTNMACGLDDEALSHGQTLSVAGTAAPVAAGLIEAVVGALCVGV
jgi:purine-nucleoside phosphorylase